MRASRWIAGLALAAAVLAAGSARAQAGCAPGADEACYRQALDLTEKALGGARRDEAALRQALALFESVCGRGMGDACYFAGRIVGAQTGQVTRSLDSGGERAVDLFQAGCHAPDPSPAACNALGFAPAYAPGVAPPDSALHHLLDGCERGSATACGRAAALLNDWSAPAARVGTLPDSLERTACRRGSPVGCMRLGERVRALRSGAPRGRWAGDVPGEAPRADAVVRAACHRGLPTACTAMGIAYATGGPGLRRQLDSASLYFHMACLGPTQEGDDPSWVGDGRGCAQAGYLAMRRGATAGDSAVALQLFGIGCESLDSDACADLALFSHRLGRADEMTALRAVTACNEGSGYGCWVASELYNEGVRPDPARAEGYLRQACALGYGPGCADLGNIAQADGRLGTPFKHLRRACDLRDGVGCLLYGMLVAPADAAARWQARACDYGAVEGCWELSRTAAAEGREVEAGVYRSRACRLDPASCKRKN